MEYKAKAKGMHKGFVIGVPYRKGEKRLTTWEFGECFTYKLPGGVGLWRGDEIITLLNTPGP